MSLLGDTEGRSQRSAVHSERVETVIIGGGQAGLSVGYQLARLGRPFVILEANERIGDSWRKRWDSLELFTPARYNGLAGMPFPAEDWSFPTKDEMADYLESYAAHFELPVRTGVRVERLSKDGERFVVADWRGASSRPTTWSSRWRAGRGPGSLQFARELDPGIVQLHSYEYRNPSQLQGRGRTRRGGWQLGGGDLPGRGGGTCDRTVWQGYRTSPV